MIREALLSEYLFSPDTGSGVLDPLLHLSPNSAVKWIALFLFYIKDVEAEPGQKPGLPGAKLCRGNSDGWLRGADARSGHLNLTDLDPTQR